MNWDEYIKLFDEQYRKQNEIVFEPIKTKLPRKIKKKNKKLFKVFEFQFDYGGLETYIRKTSKLRRKKRWRRE